MRLIVMSCLMVGWLHGAIAAEIIPLTGPLQPLSKPQATLTLTTNGQHAKLTLAEIERLPMKQTTLQTQWGVNGTYQGVLIKDLLAAHPVNKNSKRLIFNTLDKYVAGLSIKEFDNSPAFLATRFEGKPIPPDNKGPFILMWPTKAEAVMQGKALLSSWVWSVAEISAE